MVLIHHPDRASDAEKSDANEKFNVLHQAYVILSDPEKKKQYDAGTDILFGNTTSARWDHFVKPVTTSEINIAREKYQNSNQEECDILREYSKGKGSMTHILNNLPFMRAVDEPRVMAIIMRLIDLGRVQKFKIKKIQK